MDKGRLSGVIKPFVMARRYVDLNMPPSALTNDYEQYVRLGSVEIILPSRWRLADLIVTLVLFLGGFYTIIAGLIAAVIITTPADPAPIGDPAVPSFFIVAALTVVFIYGYGARETTHHTTDETDEEAR
jgi:hypothetical protein